MVDGRRSEQFSAGVPDVRQQVQLVPLLRNGIHGVGLVQMEVLVPERDLETESLAVSSSERN